MKGMTYPRVNRPSAVRWWIFPFVLLAPLAPAKADEQSDRAITQQAQATLETMVDATGPGAVVLIALGDRVVFRAARGLANVELGVALTSADEFRIASLTKMFTAALVLKLADAGELGLDDTLGKFLADFPNADKITIRELLAHTSGISDAVRDPQPGFSRRDVDTAALVAQIRKRPLDFVPGSRWSYSNAGYILLGAVIEKVTGLRWYEAVEKQLLDPLRLSATRYGAAGPLISRRVAGYTIDAQTKAVANAAYISASIPAAAGGLVSDADDLLRWMRELARGRVLGAKLFSQMTASSPRLPGGHETYAYGMGMYLWRVRGERMVGHTGQIDGFASALAYLPQADITIVVLANSDEFDARTAARRFAAIALGSPYTAGTAVPISAHDMEALAGRYGTAESGETVSAKDGRLFAQRGTHKAVQLQMMAGGELHFLPDELSYFLPVRDASGSVVALDDFEDGEPPARRLPRQPSLSPD